MCSLTPCSRLHAIIVACEEYSWPEVTGLRWYRWLELRCRWCRQQYNHFDTACQRPKGNLPFSFALVMSTSYGCASRCFHNLPAMSIKTTLHATAPLLYPCLRYSKCSWGICFTSSGSNGGCWVVLVPPSPFGTKDVFFHTQLMPKKTLRPKKAQFMPKKGTQLALKTKVSCTYFRNLCKLRFPPPIAHPAKAKPKVCPVYPSQISPKANRRE